MDRRDKVEIALDSIRPFLQRDGGDVELIDITDDNVVKVKLLGACETCSMSQMTLKAGIEEAIKNAIPEINAIQSV